MRGHGQRIRLCPDISGSDGDKMVWFEAVLEVPLKVCSQACPVSFSNVTTTYLQVERMLQLHLACEQRIGVIIVGPSGSGKSTLWQVRTFS